MLHQIQMANIIALEELYNPKWTECQQIAMFLL